jgi:hypothetical protein
MAINASVPITFGPRPDVTRAKKTAVSDSSYATPALYTFNPLTE